MGKKRVIQKPEEETVKESAPKTDAAVLSRPETGHKSIGRGIAFIQATYNNTIITISDENGNVLGWSSSGSLGFRGAKKSTPYAAARVAEAVVEKVKKYGLKEIDVKVSGVGSGRDSAIRSLANHGLDISSIRDTTPIPHNGPRPPKVRRV
jgi:small subunit ribosomal protein S11